jgi:hypothetical protein
MSVLAVPQRGHLAPFLSVPGKLQPALVQIEAIPKPNFCPLADDGFLLLHWPLLLEQK